MKNEKTLSHEFFMKEALKEAKIAFEEDEVPVGAIIVCNNKIIARSHNMCEKLKDVTAHAEMLAITSAQNYLNSKHLNNCSIYITIEPCLMCAAAIKYSKIKQIIFGCYDKKFGIFSNNIKLFNSKTNIISGIFEKESAELLKKFFNKKRNKVI